MYGAYIYDTAEILLRTDGRTDGRTNKAILGVGCIIHDACIHDTYIHAPLSSNDVCMFDAYILDPDTRGHDAHIYDA